MFAAVPIVSSAGATGVGTSMKRMDKVFYGYLVMKKRKRDKQYYVHNTYAKHKDAQAALSLLVRSGWDAYMCEDYR
jgi:hypothetical protein